VIDSDGTQLGVISRDEAQKKADEQGLDLVEVAANAVPPVARILEFKKFRYEESKKEQLAKKHSKDVELKELWFTPRIAEHDIQTRLNRVDEFLKQNHKIMLRVKFKGREMGHQELGYQVLQKIFEQLGDKIAVERPAKMEGRSITAIIGKASAKSGAPAESIDENKSEN
jgi:translation initiation factor IF-3